MKKTTGTKLLAMVLAVVLVLGAVIGGTMAWLIDATESVENTFTYGDINIGLDENPTDDGDEDPNTNEYEMMPGQEIVKDPKVTVKAGSEAAWLFVKLEKSENYDDFLEMYTIADGWAQLYDAENNPVEGVFYRFQAEIPAEGEQAVDAVYPVLKDDKLIVKSTVTKEMLNALDDEENEANYPTLTITAYAVQYVGFEAVVEEGATEATPGAVNAAALAAWNAAVEQLNPTEEP